MIVIHAAAHMTQGESSCIHIRVNTSLILAGVFFFIPNRILDTDTANNAIIVALNFALSCLHLFVLQYEEFRISVNDDFHVNALFIYTFIRLIIHAIFFQSRRRAFSRGVLGSHTRIRVRRP